LRSIEQTQQSTDALWSGVLDNLAKPHAAAQSARLIFNLENPLVRRLVDLANAPAFAAAIKMLYVQALLMAHQPLSDKEWKLLNDGLLTLVESSITGSSEERS
jgi:HSP90 family molecular chaperone